MSYYVQDAAPSEAWAASPMNGVDLNAEAGIALGGNAWHARMTVELWSLVIILGALVALWVLGGVVFRRVNVL